MTILSSSIGNGEAVSVSSSSLPNKIFGWNDKCQKLQIIWLELRHTASRPCLSCEEIFFGAGCSCKEQGNTYECTYAIKRFEELLYNLT